MKFHTLRRRCTMVGLVAGLLAPAAVVQVSAGSGQGASEAAGVGNSAGASVATALDPRTITSITGGSPEVSGNVVKVSFPRKDVPVQIDGWNDVPPFMGLTSYASFMPLDSGGVMAMGDLVVFEDEVNPVMSAALDAGLDVTALHNHFFFAKPAVYFMHIGGKGNVNEVATGPRSTPKTGQA